MKPVLSLLLFVAALLLSFQSHAMTGIDSAGYIWLIIPVLIGLILLLVMVVKFLKRIKKDCLEQDNQTNTPK